MADKKTDIAKDEDVINRVKDLVGQMAEAQVAAFEAGNIEDFMKWFELDPYDDYYLRRWFNGYAVKVAQPNKCIVSYGQPEKFLQSFSSITMTFKLDYLLYDSETAIFDYKFKYSEEYDSIIIIKSKMKLKDKPHRDNVLEQNGNAEGNTSIHLFSNVNISRIGVMDELEKEWWKSSRIMDIHKSSSDCLKANFYSRAIPKSVRFRNTHPEIDCAAFLSDMMTFRISQMAFSMGTGDLANMAKRINTFASKNMISRTNNQDYNSAFSVRELSLLPQYNIDEVFAFKRCNMPMEASCTEMTSFYASMLRHGGMGANDIFIVTQPFHYLTIFRLDKGYYIINGNDIMAMSPSRLYGDTEVTRIVSPIYFLDNTGQSNMPSEVISNVKDFFAEGVPIFSIPEGRSLSNVLPTDTEPKTSIRNCSTPIELHMELKKYVYEMSMKYSASTFTWAKYSYQTLLVNQPQTYLAWSLKSSESQAFAAKYDSLEKLFNWMGKYLEWGSIFYESDRIMTADQVIRHRRANPNDRAVLIFTIARLSQIGHIGGVVITDKGAYVVISDDDINYKIYNARTLEKISKIYGKVITAFDDESSFSIFQGNSDKEPKWLENIL